MGETLCNAYSSGDVDTLPSMEDILYDTEYSIYNKDGNGDTPLDDLIYYMLFECDT